VATKARKRAPRHVPDLDHVVDVTIELLEKHGEGGFRVEELIERTGIAKSSMYLRFGSRDGLLAAAYSKVFKAQVMESVSGLTAIVRQSRTASELRTGLRAATAFVASPERFKNRLQRAAIIAGVRGRPEYQRSLSEAQREMTTAIAKLFEEAQYRGLINIKYSPRVAAQFIQAVTFGRVIAEIESLDDHELLADWMSACGEMFDHMMFDGLVDD